MQPTNQKRTKKTDIEAEAISIVTTEKRQWEDATTWITDRVAFRMRELIRTFRKNNWGVFDDPIDPITGQEKIWIPLTESLVDAVVKNFDMDQKDIGFRAKNKEGYEATSVTRLKVKEWLDSLFFGEKLDELERTMAIDGTGVWKTWEENGQVKFRMVDLLNCYIDPTSDSIQSAYRFTERAIMTPQEIAQMSGWRNTEGLIGATNLSRNDGEDKFLNDTTAMYRDVYEMWGYIPKYLITGKKSDKDEMVPNGHIIVSGIDASSPVCHLIELFDKKGKDGQYLKPYEEAWYMKVPGRWYGKGIAEKVMFLQMWLNTVVNIRINRGRVSQLGLFKIKRGAGITPQHIKRLSTNGALLVQDMRDIEQMVIQEASQASYKDEEVIKDWAQRTTAAFDVVTGEGLPSTTTATSAAIQDRNARSTFTLVREGLGLFLQRWIDRHVLPAIANTIKPGDTLRLATDEEFAKDYIDSIANYYAMQQVNYVFANTQTVPTELEIYAFVDNAKQKALKQKDIFVEAEKNVIANSVYTKVYVTNEELDIGVTVQKLIDVMKISPKYAESLTKQVIDLLGLEQPRETPQPQMAAEGATQTPADMSSPQSLQALVTQGNVEGQIA